MQKVSLYTVLPLVASSVIVWAQAQGKAKFASTALSRQPLVKRPRNQLRPPRQSRYRREEARSRRTRKELRVASKFPNRSSLTCTYAPVHKDDFGYNAPTLGWSPFYGRLMNETPRLVADFGYHVVRPETPGLPRATLFMRIEGRQLPQLCMGNGSLNFGINHVWLETENVLFKTTVTQTGNLWFLHGLHRYL